MCIRDRYSTSITGTWRSNYSGSSSYTGTWLSTLNIIFYTRPDNQPPVITRSGDATVTLEVGTTYTEAGATASDTKDGTLTVTVGGDTVDVNTVGTYTITYNVSDAAGNAATQVTRTVNVIDSTPPTLQEVTAITTPSNNTTPSYVFSSNEAGTITSSLTLTGDTAAEASNTNVVSFATLGAGTYTPTVTVTDAAGNAGTKTLTSFVIDTTAPSAFDVGTVITSGGTVVSGKLNGTNTTVTVTVPIADDATLNGGTVQLQAKVGEGAYINLGGTSAISAVNADKEIAYAESDLDGIAGFAEGVVLTFRAIITDTGGT